MDQPIIVDTAGPLAIVEENDAGALVVVKLADDSAQGARYANAAAASATTATTEAAAASASATSAATSASQALQAATAAQGTVHTLMTSVSAGGALPFEVSALSGSFVGTGTGGTPGEYALTVSGGPAGHTAFITIGSDGKIASARIGARGIAAANTAPTYALPSGTGLTGATLPTATVSAIQDGRIFLAPNANSGATVLLGWQASSGVIAAWNVGGVQWAEYFKSALDPLVTSLVTNGSAALTISDASKRIVLRINADGGTELVRLTTPKVTSPTVEVGSGGTTLQSSNGNPFTIKDLTNHVVFDVDANGLTRMVSGQANKFAADSLFRKNSFLGATDRRPGVFPAEINHIIYYGQSWAGGFDAIPVINTTQPYDTLMFNLNAQGEGIRQQYSVAQDATALQSFVPAVETQRVGTPEFPTSNVGETGAVAMANEIKRLILAENNTAMTDQSFQLLVSYPGEGSKQIETLADPAGVYMQRVIEQIQRGYAIAQSMGKTYAVLCVTWLQGSSSISTPYAQQLEAMRAYISAQAQSIVPGQGEVPLITWEQYPNTNTSLATNGSALGVYTRYVGAADTYPYIYCSGPAYQYGQVSATNIHYLPAGMADIGRDFAFAIKRAVIDQTAYEPLRPVSLKRQGKIALVKFNVAAGQLTLDTTNVVAQTNYGFNLYDSGGTLIPISSVSIIGPDTIKIVASTSIPSGATLRYADTGTDATNANKWRGNIRDNLGDLGQRNRWLIAFSYAFSN